MDDFLAAVDSRQGINIIIGGQAVFVPRCRLLRHLQLSQIEVKIGENRHPVEISGQIIKYLSLGGITNEQLKEASAYELLEAFFALRRLNAWQWLLPWLSKPNTTPSDPEVYEYEGRRWAVWVHRLASRYGWGLETIWGLYPEEAAAYIQEIMVSEYYEREDQRALSELSYKYDNSTRSSRFVPAPMFSWMIDESPPEPIRVLIRTLPVGNVIKLEN